MSLHSRLRAHVLKIAAERLRLRLSNGLEVRGSLEAVSLLPERGASMGGEEKLRANAETGGRAQLVPLEA